jgi:O-antigen ligase
VAYLATAALATCILFLAGPRLLKPMLWPIYVAIVGWIIISVIYSDNFDLSARRAIFQFIVLYLAAIVCTLVTSPRQLADVLALVVLSVIALSFLGVALLPDLSIHQATDLIEPRLEGDWRGLFQHKNIAGAMMVIFIFIGAWIAKVRRPVIGWAIVLSAVIFLSFTHAKTASLLLPATLIMAWLCGKIRSAAGIGAAALSGLVLLNLVTIGSATSPAIRSALQPVISETSFTGRDEIWRFAADQIGSRWLTGHGFMAFWRTEATQFGGLEKSDARKADHAHNSYLDLALSIGLPGLAIALLAFVVAPIRDFTACRFNPGRQELALLFLRIWIFGIYLSCLESVLLDRANPIWFSLLLAIFGLRFLAYHSRLAPKREPAALTTAIVANPSADFARPRDALVDRKE